MSLEPWFRSTASAFGTCVLVAALSACAGETAPEPEEEATEEMPAAEGEDMEEPSGEPRVFFVEPEEGAQVTSPVKARFGAENFTIEPVGEGEVHEGAGHYHIGVNTDCLPPGEVIPEAEPWIHFGDGSNEIDVQLPPGEHKLALQIGDGEHRTLPEEGLCEVITITVVEGESEEMEEEEDEPVA